MMMENSVVQKHGIYDKNKYEYKKYDSSYKYYRYNY